VSHLQRNNRQQASGLEATASSRACIPAIERFNCSIGFDLPCFPRISMLDAHARMLGGCGVISLAEADGLDPGLEAVAGRGGRRQLSNPGLEAEGTSTSLGERRLIRDARARWSKEGCTRPQPPNDQVGTDLRLWLRQKIDGSIKVWRRFQLGPSCLEGRSPHRPP